MYDNEYNNITADFNPRSPSGLRLPVIYPPGIDKQFQSTQPEWAATGGEYNHQLTVGISIHAARVGCDCSDTLSSASQLISIHAARVGCDKKSDKHKPYTNDISIHAARVGCDLLLLFRYLPQK